VFLHEPMPVPGVLRQRRPVTIGIHPRATRCPSPAPRTVPTASHARPEPWQGGRAAALTLGAAPLPERPEAPSSVAENHVRRGASLFRRAENQVRRALIRISPPRTRLRRARTRFFHAPTSSSPATRHPSFAVKGISGPPGHPRRATDRLPALATPFSPRRTWLAPRRNTFSPRRTKVRSREDPSGARRSRSAAPTIALTAIPHRPAPSPVDGLATAARPPAPPVARPLRALAARGLRAFAHLKPENASQLPRTCALRPMARALR
jgi:hypothetical protein